MRGISKNRSIKIGLCILCILLFLAVFADFIAPYDPNQKDLDERLIKPCYEHPFGTDHLGRDILSRVIFGSRVSIFIGVSVTVISLIIGILLGITAGYYGGVVDELIMRIVDGFLAFPSMFLALGVTAFLGQGVFNLMVALTVVQWTTFARVARGSTLDIKARPYVEASRWLGAGNLYTITRHVLPNILPPLLIVASLGIGNVILTAAGLSFLGLGVQPSIPEWGSMLNDGRVFLIKAPYIMIFPGLMIMITVLAFNFLGDGLRDMMDQRIRHAELKRKM
ncbi:nickel transporter permease [Methanococcoides sp.]|jgi:peptide/nickel transport system permease protein|uniref:nickel transporter permease n=1 Tax=Methanococcoides sp. TaxID=1966350 RepID=UPI00272E35DB|nr:nickel transporter permease [Methanococcoides sp.]